MICTVAICLQKKTLPLQIHNGTTYDTFEEVARAKGLLTFDMNEVHVALQEVQANHGSPGDLRKTFLICLKHCTFDTKVMSSSALYFFILFLLP